LMSQRCGRQMQRCYGTSIAREKPKRSKAWIGALVVAGVVSMHPMLGYKHNFYDRRFLTDKDPDDLAGFYGGEEFMELWTVFPFVRNIMMRKAKLDDDGTIHAPMGFEVSMVFTDGENEGVTSWFNKREVFQEKIGPFTLIDMVTNFGFRALPDGRVQVYHQGESFYGPWIVRLLFEAHARYVWRATAHHVNKHAFTSESDEDEEIEEECRDNFIKHCLFRRDTRLFLGALATDVQNSLESHPEHVKASHNCQLHEIHDDHIQTETSIQGQKTRLKIIVKDKESHDMMLNAIDRICDDSNSVQNRVPESLLQEAQKEFTRQQTARRT